MGETLQGIAKLSFVNAIYLVSHPSFMEKTHEVALQENLEKIKAIIPGGNSREESVYEAMKYLSTTTIDPDDVVMICDGDRPYIEERIFSENAFSLNRCSAMVTVSRDFSSTHDIGFCEYSNTQWRMLPMEQSGSNITSSASKPHSRLQIGITPADISVVIEPACPSEQDGRMV